MHLPPPNNEQMILLIAQQGGIARVVQFNYPRLHHANSGCGKEMCILIGPC